MKTARRPAATGRCIRPEWRGAADKARFLRAGLLQSPWGTAKAKQGASNPVFPGWHFPSKLFFFVSRGQVPVAIGKETARSAEPQRFQLQLMARDNRSDSRFNSRVGQLGLGLGYAIMTGLTGCAFDVVSVRQIPATFESVAGAPATFVLRKEVEVSIGTGFKTRLRQGTSWRQVGKIAQGTVFTTKDQVVTVEASNISEAQIVVFGQRIVGFYLPVEHTFAPASSPISLEPNPQP